MSAEIQSSEASEIDCPYCAEKINAKAKKCKHCNEMIDATMRELEILKAQKNVTHVTNTASVHTPHLQYTPLKSRGTAILLCLFLGGIGAHKFYLGQPGLGVLYLLFFWTFIPAVFALFEFIILLCTSEAAFNQKYNHIVRVVSASH